MSSMEARVVASSRRSWSLTRRVRGICPVLLRKACRLTKAVAGAATCATTPTTFQVAIRPAVTRVTSRPRQSPPSRAAATWFNTIPSLSTPP